MNFSNYTPMNKNSFKTCKPICQRTSPCAFGFAGIARFYRGYTFLFFQISIGLHVFLQKTLKKFADSKISSTFAPNSTRLHPIRTAGESFFILIR
jgi:hypothetical protein